jgi:hypothetical protein
MKTKFAIGCLIQWYELDIIDGYLISLQDAISIYDKDNVIIDIIVTDNTMLERPISNDTLTSCMSAIMSKINRLDNVNVRIESSLYTIADYRRQFNDRYCDQVDVLVWGETDMLVPKQTFQSLDILHQSQSNSTPKYIATFAICKMWDDTWKPLEHVRFTDFDHSDSKEDWWGLNYDMTIDEMNKFNDAIDELDVTILPNKKFNGCGLVISSEVIKSGVNIPRSAFFIHEDTAFMLMIQRVLSDIPQYHFRNLLMVHNRKHSNKRNYISGETGNTVGQKRNSNKWYTLANKMSEQNVYNMFNPNYKSFTWEDVWKSI